MGSEIMTAGSGTPAPDGQVSVARENKPLDRVYDVFLSHRRRDEALVTELYDYIEEALGFEAYVDWKDSLDELDRAHVTEKTADYLRSVMRHASSLIFVVGEDPGQSRWTPWELGFFDGRQSARRIGVYLPDGVELPEGLEYLGLYGRPVLRKADLRGFLEDATLDVAAMDSAQQDQWWRHLQRLMTRPDDYWLSVLQWQLGYAANLMTEPNQAGLLPEDQPRDVPREPAALFGPWLQWFRQCQYGIGELRLQRHRAYRAAFGSLRFPALPEAPEDLAPRGAAAIQSPLPVFADLERLVREFQGAMNGATGRNAGMTAMPRARL